jgi:hypothetical protein
MVGGACTAALYSGTGLTLNQVGSNVTPTLTSTGRISVTLSGTVNGYVAVQLVLTTIPSGAYPGFAAAPASPAAMAQTPAGTYIVGTKNATAAPGSTLVINSGWTTAAARPWIAANAF